MEKRVHSTSRDDSEDLDIPENPDDSKKHEIPRTINTEAQETTNVDFKPKERTYSTDFWVRKGYYTNRCWHESCVCHRNKKYLV